MLLGIFTFIIYPKALNVLNIEPGGKQEKFSLLFQQTARYVKTYPNDVTEQEKNIISKVLDYDKLATDYNPIFADPIKGYTQIGNDEDYVEYIKVWIKQGIRHPMVYIDATNAMISGTFTLRKYIPWISMDWHSQLDTSFIPEEVTIRGDIFKKSSEKVVNIYDKLYNIPVIGKILSYGFWASLLPAFALITLFKYRKNNEKINSILVIIPLLASIALGLWLAPVTAANMEGLRYFYPVIYTGPLTIIWCCYCIKINNDLKQKGEKENGK